MICRTMVTIRGCTSPSARNIARCESGGAAVEFGILAPLLLLMLLGTIELGRAINADRHFVGAVSSAGDLVAREADLGTTQAAATANLNGMMQSIKHLMQPYDANSLKLGIFSVRASANDGNKAKVEWRYSYNGASVPAKCADYTLPKDILAPGGSVIIVDATYGFKSLFGSYVPGMRSSMTWSNKSYHSPRNKCVNYVEGDNCINPC